MDQPLLLQNPDPPDPAAEHALTLATAGIYLNDAAKGRALFALTDETAIRCRKLYHAAWYRRSIVAVATIHMGLAILEPATAGKEALLPTWCYLLLEFALLAAYTLDCAVQWRFMGHAHFWGPGTSRWKAALTLAVAIDFVAALVEGEDAVRVTRVLRPAILVLRLRNVRNIFEGVAYAFPKLVLVLALSTFQVMLYAIVGVLVFDPQRNKMFGDEVTTGYHCSPYLVDGCDDYFGSLQWAMYQLWLAQQRTSFPNIMQPYFRASPWSAIFFVSFLLVNYFFLYKLFLATAFDSYKRHAERQFRAYLANQLASTRAAYSLLVGLSPQGRGITPDVWVCAVHEARPGLPRGVAEQMFRAADETRRRGYLDFDAFVDAASLLALGVTKEAVEQYSSSPYDRTRQRFAELLISRPFDVLVNLVIVGCVAHMVGDTTENSQRVDIVYFALFANEIGLKAWAFGPRVYLQSNFNRLDVVAVASSLVAIIIGSASSSNEWLQAVLALRTLRVLRTIRLLRRFRNFFAALSAIVPVLLRVLVVLVSVIYSFAVVGMDLFSGALSEDNAKVAASSYGQSDLYDFNFDSFTSTLLLLFQLLLVSKFGIYLEGLVAGTSSAAVAYTYFIAFDLAVVEFTVNVLVAFILEAYLSHARTDQRQLQSRWKAVVSSLEPVVQGNTRFVLAERNNMFSQHRAMFQEKLSADGDNVHTSEMMELTSAADGRSSLNANRDATRASMKALVVQLEEKTRECEELKALLRASTSGSEWAAGSERASVSDRS